MGIIYKNGIPYGNQPSTDAVAMIEPSEEASATSAHAYAVGEHFIYNDTLYRATAAIAIGDTITPDTNCVATNVMTEVESGGGGGGFDKLNSTQAADAYDPTATYAVGDKVSYAGNVYSCISAISTPEAWDSTHWDQVDPIQDQVDDVRNTLNTKADVIYDTASGDIASFPDGADGLPVKDLTVAIEPVQDLHGYDNPWPAGGGKNKYNSAETEWGSGILDDDGNPVATVASHYTLNFTAVKSGTNYILSGSVSSTNVQIRIYFYTESKTWISRTGGTSASTCAFSTPANCNFIRIQVGSAITSTSDWQVEEGSTATAYAPFENICPISGWTGANVIGVGEALSGFEQGALNSNGMNSESDARIRTKNYIPVVPGKKYYIHAFPTVSGKITQAYIYFYNKADYSTNKKDRIGWLQLPTTFTVPNNSMYIRFVLSYTVWEDVNPSNFNPVFLWPNNEKTSVSISWQSEAGTVYGGTLDVTTGVLTVTDANIASYNGETLPGEWISDRDVYAAGTTPTTGAQVVYKLATPQTYQLTPQEVTTLLGQNNVWADTGDSTVEYPCDTKLYIERLTAPEEDDMIANQNIASGVYFMIGNNLYLSTAAILAGDPIKPGTNCTLTNLAAALNALNS